MTAPQIDAFTLTCSARIRLQADTATQASSMLLEFPASPLWPSPLQGEGTKRLPPCRGKVGAPSGVWHGGSACQPNY